jgi:hypothetical protein
MARLVVLSLALSAFAFAQDKKKEEPEPKKDAPPKADVRGKVESAFGVKERGVVGKLLIKGVKESDTTCDQAWVKVTTATKLYRFSGGKKAAAVFSDIKKGDRAQAVFTGPVVEGTTLQATASEVMVIEPEKKEEK